VLAGRKRPMRARREQRKVRVRVAVTARCAPAYIYPAMQYFGRVFGRERERERDHIRPNSRRTDERMNELATAAAAAAAAAASSSNSGGEQQLAPAPLSFSPFVSPALSCFYSTPLLRSMSFLLPFSYVRAHAQLSFLPPLYHNEWLRIGVGVVSQ